MNGQPEQGAWYFEYSAANAGYPVEGHFRLQNYWPAHAKVHIDIPAKGLSAGKGLSFDDSLTSDWNTGPRNVSTVDDSTHRMTVTSDGHTYGTFPVSLGASNTPTARGIKVIMEKGRSICMRGPGYYECGVKYTQRLTYGGEYLHSAPWNISHINSGVDSSNGCTNLLPTDAQRLYGFLNIGDVVIYPNANGPAMSLGAGYGDWNVDWIDLEDRRSRPHRLIRTPLPPPVTSFVALWSSTGATYAVPSSAMPRLVTSPARSAAADGLRQQVDGRRGVLDADQHLLLGAQRQAQGRAGAHREAGVARPCRPRSMPKHCGHVNAVGRRPR